MVVDMVEAEDLLLTMEDTVAVARLRTAEDEVAGIAMAARPVVVDGREIVEVVAAVEVDQIMIASVIDLVVAARTEDTVVDATKMHVRRIMQT